MRKKHIVLLGALVVLILCALLVLRSQHDGGAATRSGTASSAALSVPENSVHVERVIDGDTIDVRLGTKTERVRLIGIDTPETVDERKPVQCYGSEASEKMKELLTDRSVVLEAKPDEDRDDYGRLLRYVFLGDTDIGARMLAEGYARSLCAAFPHPKCDAYGALEQTARREKRGRWGACR